MGTGRSTDGRKGLGGRRSRRDPVDWDRFAEGAPTSCEVCGKKIRKLGPINLHHVVEKQRLRWEGGDISDPRNRLVVCDRCHSQHTAGWRISARKLRGENILFALSVLGPTRAIAYLRRNYLDAGDDPRLNYPED